MKLYCNEVTVGKENKVLVTINQEEQEEKVQKKRVKQLHHIHIIDRSGSMAGSIDELIDDVKVSFEKIGKEDFVTVIWFSSHDQCKVLIKGAKVSKDLHPLMDSMKSVVYLTCFSTPLKETEKIVEELNAICPHYNVTLFTDGVAVVPWGEKEEENKCLQILQSLSKKIIALNTVGYGYYYNQEFLKKLSCETKFGQFVHSSNIKEYSKIFTKNFEKIQNMCVEKVDIKANGMIMYLNRNFCSTDFDTFSLDQIDSEKNQFFLMDSDHFEFEYNGKKYNSKSIKDKVSEPTIRNFYYAHAYQCYYNDMRMQSFDILFNNLKEKYLIDSQTNSFTFDECQEHINKLEAALFNTSARMMTGQCNDKYVPKEDAFCVMDLFSLLLAENAFYLPFHSAAKEYERIGKKVSEDSNNFKATDYENTCTPFSNFISNKTKMNLSLTFPIKGYVCLDKKEAKQVGLKDKFETTIFRTHTFINDGNLNIKRIVCLLKKDTQKFLADKVKMSAVDFEHSKDDYVSVVIYLNNLPVINRQYLNVASNVNKVFELAQEIVELEFKQKVVNTYIKRYDTITETSRFTEEQLEVLDKHGINKYGLYVGKNAKVESNQDCDYYLIREIDFCIKGLSSIPSLDDLDVKWKSGKKLTYSYHLLNCKKAEVDLYLNERHIQLTADNPILVNALITLKESIKNQLTSKRNYLNGLKMTKVLNNDWFDGFKKDEDGNFYFEKNEKRLILKMERTKQYYS